MLLGAAFLLAGFFFLLAGAVFLLAGFFFLLAGAVFLLSGGVFLAPRSELGVVLAAMEDDGGDDGSSDEGGDAVHGQHALEAGHAGDNVA